MSTLSQQIKAGALNADQIQCGSISYFIVETQIDGSFKIVGVASSQKAVDGSSNRVIKYYDNRHRDQD